MKLILEGHEYKYAAEQILLSMLPGEKPEYGDLLPGEDYARVRLNVAGKYCTATAKLCYRGKESLGTARVSADLLKGKLERDRQCQKVIRQAFYRAAVRLTEEKPEWGALTGIRPGTIFTKMLEQGLTENAAISRMCREHFVSRERAELCAHTARASLQVKRRLDRRDIAVYVGIPFCPTRCAYCSFVSASVEKSMALIPPFLSVLHREIEELGRIIKELSLNVIAVYIGGGTPTTLSAEEITALIAKMRESFDFSNVEEFSLEAGRPDTITEEKLAAMEKGGVTRISINPQSMSDDVLRAIGRKHSAADVAEAFKMARRLTTADINMDLIAGLPGDTPATFAETLRLALLMDPENITVHTLALKKGTRLTLEGGDLPGKQDVAAMLETARRELTGAGYLPYYLYRQKFMSGGFENIGWAKSGKESLYNILIMEELCTILAAGGGASTKLVDAETGRVERIFDYKYPKEYIEGAEKTLADKAKILEFYK